ncbi:MAG: nuclear transport factor 2 family protein [Flavobacteriaceae bacterium]
MKKLILLGLIAVFMACQPGPPRYTNSSAEIDTFKAHINDYNEGNWESWLSHYADTAKVSHNTTEESSPKEALEGMKTNLEATSSYGFLDKDIFYEMVIDDKNEKWVNFWGTWEGTLAANSKKLTITVHVTAQFVGNKIVEEHAYYDLSQFVTAMQEIEAAKMAEEAMSDEE